MSRCAAAEVVCVRDKGMNMAPKVLSPSQNPQFSGPRSVERLIDEACFSGEILLCGRKLKDFPKVAAAPTTNSAAGGHRNLEDTVFAGNLVHVRTDGQTQVGQRERGELSLDCDTIICSLLLLL